MMHHPFHVLGPSPWPFMASIATFSILFGAVVWFHTKMIGLFIMGLFLMVCVMSVWWRDVIRESTFQGCHTNAVAKSIMFGMVLFIVSEVMFFFSFFWAFFHSVLVPCVEIGATWPPAGISTFDPFNVALLNTVILLSSGVTVTWAHHSLIFGKMEESLMSQFITVLLGLVFLIIQGWEWSEAMFTISDGIYGSLFFVMTGFHGIHVLVGFIFLSVALCRTYYAHFKKDRHLGFELAAWYWHFVDVVWILLYICIYWWGS